MLQTENGGCCPSGFQYFEHTKKCYKFIHKQLSWSESESECRSFFGGHLASVHDLKTNDFLFSLMMPNYGNAFIGGYKKADGQWYWTDGTTMDYLHWHQDNINKMPDNVGGEENYMEIFYTFGRSFWNDMNLVHKHPEVKHGFICQVEM